jgi:hypothetical protein
LSLAARVMSCNAALLPNSPVRATPVANGSEVMVYAADFSRFGTARDAASGPPEEDRTADIVLARDRRAVGGVADEGCANWDRKAARMIRWWVTSGSRNSRKTSRATRNSMCFYATNIVPCKAHRMCQDTYSSRHFEVTAGSAAPGC